MNRKDSPQSVIDSYRRRQQMAPYFLAGFAVLLVVVGIIILVVWFAGNGKSKAPAISLFASPTPTVTETATPTPVTPTATFTSSPTVTISPTATVTVTPSGPFEYTVKDGDTCWDIAANNKVDINVLLALNNFGTSCPIVPGGKILIPQPGAELPTETPFPTGAPGTKTTYVVQFGDTLALIAGKFNTTTDEIMKENNLKDANTIDVGMELKITMNTIKPTATKAASMTSTPGGPTATKGAAITATPTVGAPTLTATITPKP